MAYIGNDLQVAYPTYKNIDDISGSFNGSTTSFALLVGGVAPSPLPLNSQQCLISVGGVIQRPDDTGTEGFRLSGGNIVFSSAPSTGEDFFGVILAGADYVNVGANFPSGSAAVPSITFDSDLDTGIYNSAANQVGIACAGSSVSVFSSAGQSFLAGSAGAPSLYPSGDTNTGIWSPAADTIAISTGGSERTRVDSSGRLLVGTSTATNNLRLDQKLAVVSTGQNLYGGVSLTSYSGTASGARSVLDFQRSRGTVDGSYTVVANSDDLGSIIWRGSDGSQFLDGAIIAAVVDGTPGSNDLPTRLVFSTTADGASSPTERLRIDSNGTTRAKGSTTTNAAAALQAVNSADTLLFSARNDGAIFTGLAGQSPYNLTTANPSNVVVESNGFLYRSTSSLKYKKEVATATYGLAELLQLRPVTYKGIGESDGEKVFGGLIAEEVHEVGLTEFVLYSSDGQPDALAYSNMVSLCIKAIQEQQAMITELQTKVAALEAS